MASRPKTHSKVIHRQTFQNSNNVVQLTLTAYPKQNLQDLTSQRHQHQFVRDCAIRKELENIEIEKNNNNAVADRRAKPAGNKKQVKGKEPRAARLVVEVTRKKSQKKAHPYIPLGGTWRDVLQESSSDNSQSLSGEPPASSCIPPQYQQPQQQEGARVRVQSRRAESPPLQHQDSTTNPVQSRSVQTSRLDPLERLAEAPFSEGVLGSCGQHWRARGFQEGIQLLNPPEPPAAERSREFSPRGHHHEPAVPQPDQGVESRRLLPSDDVNASPFGESALQILRQLKARLQRRGDSEGSEMVGVLEAFIEGQGSLPGVTAENQMLSRPTPSPVLPYPSVFPTPDPLIPHTVAHQQHGSCMEPEQNQYHASSGPSHQPNVADEQLPQIPEQNQYRASSGPSHQPSVAEKRPPQTPERLRVSPVYSSHQEKHYEQLSTHQEDYAYCKNSSDPQACNSCPSASTSEAHNHLHQLRDLNYDVLVQRLTEEQELNKKQARDIQQLKKLSVKLIQQQMASVGSQQGVVSPVVPSTAAERDSGVIIESREKSVECLPTDDPKARQGGGGGGGEGEAATSRSTGSSYSEVVARTSPREEPDSSQRQDYEALCQQNKDYLERIVDLQIQLMRANKQLDTRPHSGLSKHSSSAPNLNQTTDVKKPCWPASGSEADSAYEDKSESLVTSKMSSPLATCSNVSSQPRILPAISRPTDNLGEGRQTDSHLRYSRSDAKVQSRKTTVPVAVQRNHNLPKISCDPQHSNPSQGNSVLSERKERTTDILVKYRQNRVKMPNLALADLGYGPEVCMDKASCPTFSTVSEEDLDDSKSTLEQSFLHGITRKHKLQQTRYRDDSTTTLSDTNQPLESTRVDRKQLQFNVTEGTIFKPLSPKSSGSSMSVKSTRSGFDTVDVLQ